MLAKSKLNSIETLVSQKLIDMEVGHEEISFEKGLNERDKYEKMKENLKNVGEKENVRKYETEQCEFKDSKNNALANNLREW